MEKSSLFLSRRLVAGLCVLLLVASLAPLYALSFYNHPFYDDFGFSLLTRAAWTSARSLPAVAEAALRNTAGIRNTWEGTYTTSFIGALQPAVFGEGYYWITTFLLLTALLCALWFLLWQALGKGLGCDVPTCVIAFCALAFVIIQFVPDVSEAFFWFNGGTAYTLMWALCCFWAGLLLKLAQAQTKAKTALWFALLAPVTVLMGGAKYSTVLFACLLLFCFTLRAFLLRRPKRLLYLLLALLLLGCLFFSASAPGNAVRAKTLHGGMGAPKAVLQALYFGLALMGNWFSLPLAAAVLLWAGLLLPFLRQSRLGFAHPVWVTALALGLFCAQLAPTLLTGNYLGDGRTVNTYYFSYVLMACLLMVYWLGWGLKRFAKSAPSEAPAAPPQATAPPRGISLRLLSGVLALLVLGCLSCRPEGAESYGPQNMAGGSAALSLWRGEAQAYDRAMDARDALLNDPAQAAITLVPVAPIPKAFMSDALDSQSLEYVLSLYAEYYGKASVTVADAKE